MKIVDLASFIINILIKILNLIPARNRLKRLLIPMLIVLKLFKLKLLLFLPLILGLASFKKFLGFMALLIPGIIGFMKFCKPLTQTYTPPVYSPSGIGFPPSHYNSYQEPSHHHHGDTVNFGAQELAYQGYHNNYEK